jgi:predicted hotdog family 3-hydroxylacyl-ACP dehydratase
MSQEPSASLSSKGGVATQRAAWRLGSPARGCGVESTMADRAAAALERMPHAAPMRVVRGLVAAQGESSSWWLVVEEEHPLLVDGELPALAGVELVAQAAAAHAALAGASGGGGVLLRARGMRFEADTLPVGERLVATVRRTDGTDGATAAFQVELDDAAGRRLLAGSLLVRLFEEAA